ncbi:hypothetical protein DRQ23_04715 [bacterium]|nr:MAG: hypothetical protein DRQ23_04715 [bacterium]
MSCELVNARYLRVGVVTPAYWPGFKYGGPVHSLHLLLKELKKQGLNIQVYTTTLFQKDNMYMERIVDGVPVKYFPISPLSGSYGYSPGLRIHLKNTVQLFNLVIISSTWEYSTYTAMSVCTGNNVPFIFIPRGMLQRRTFRSKLWKKYPYYKILIEKPLNQARAIVFTSEFEREDTLKHIKLKSKTPVIPNGLNINSLIKEASSNIHKNFDKLEDKFLITFIGRFVWTKGLNNLILAFAKLSKEFPHVHLVLAGDGEEGYKRKMQCWIKKENIEDRVTFTGFLTGSMKFSLLKASDIFVLPSYSENFGMALVEAMAAGVPVLTTNKVGIYKEVERERAGIVVTPEPESIYYGLKKLLSEPDLRKAFSQRGRSLVLKYFDIKIVATRYIKLFEEILS